MALVTTADVQDCLLFILFVYYVATVLHFYSGYQPGSLSFFSSTSMSTTSGTSSTVFKPLTANWKFKLGAYLEIEYKE